MKKKWLVIVTVLLLFSCSEQKSNGEKLPVELKGHAREVKLIVLAPGHFHANLIQKRSIPQVNDTVHVYACSHDDIGLNQYLSAIESFNVRSEEPTQWQLKLYTGDDFVEKMVANSRGNVVILAGNNKDKTKYMHKAICVGLHVLSDKPMAIDKDGFELLEDAFSVAESNGVLLYDMMTERYDLLNIIEKLLVNDSLFFGELVSGTPEEPAVYMESIHHFYKEVSGVPLQRPAWYYDVKQQGEGIADVTTHLIDLLFWKCFPNQVINYRRDISDISATHWPTTISLDQFRKSTGVSAFPYYLLNNVDDDMLKVYANGTINFKVKHHTVGLKVIWNYQAPDSGGDTFMATMKGTKAIIKTIQNKEQDFIKQLFVQAADGMNKNDFEYNLKQTIGKIQKSYPFVSYAPASGKNDFLINIPVKLREGHESHFRYVAERFFGYLVSQKMPESEITNTLAKYYITTQAVDVANERN